MPLFEKVDTPLKKRVPVKKHSPVVEITHASRTLFINKTTTSTVKTNINSELIGSDTGGITMAFPWHFSMEMRQEPVPIMVVMFTINFRFYSDASVWLLQESERMSTDRISCVRAKQPNSRIATPLSL